MAVPDSIHPFRFCKDCEYRNICTKIPERYVFVKGSCNLYNQFQAEEKAREASSRTGKKDIGTQLIFEGMEEKDIGVQLRFEGME